VTVKPIENVVVLGGGSAGFLSAMTLRRAFPNLRVRLVHSPSIPVIGVGESTTAIFPPFLHESLGLDRRQFFDSVRPSWKLGIRFIWGDPRDSHFNYTFDHCMSQQPRSLRKMKPYYCLEDMTGASRYSVMMDQGLSPVIRTAEGRWGVDEGGGYHIENGAFIAYLESQAGVFGIDVIEGDVADVVRAADGDVTSLRLADGRILAADAFLDCSGFRSFLLGGTMGESYTSYRKSLFCDSAVVGSWRRSAPVLPYTTTETMDHGWCWQIEFPDHVTRGYVFSSQFCDADTAMREMKAANPQLGDDLKLVKFPSGRYDGFWRGNVVAIGNASGFVEPLEATALHLIVEQLRLVCRLWGEADLRIIPRLRDVANHRYRQLWDEVRDFLALHYRFNRRRDTPFWRHCRADTDLGDAQELVDFYCDAGPSTMAGAVIPAGHIFGYDGFMTMLVGQRVPTQYRLALSDDDLRAWETYLRQVRSEVAAALPMADALKLVYDPAWNWSGA